LIRGNPLLTAELFRYVQEPPSQAYEKGIGERNYLKIDFAMIESMTSMMLDNAFPDSSQTNNSNLPYFNTLRAYQQMLVPALDESK
jgi:hypothetical protein